MICLSRTFARLGVLFASTILPAVAQTATPPTAPPPAPASKTAPAPSVSTIKASAQLVVVDVVVTDSSHKPIHGLKASDFALKESNAPQAIKNFEEHTALTLADATKLEPIPKMPPGVFTNYAPAPPNGAVDLLLLDALNTPMKDQAYVRDQLLKYLKTIPPGTRVAIFGLTSRLVVLQGFTSDPEVLKSILDRGLAKASVILDDQVGGGGTQNSTADDMEDLDADPSMVANLRQFEAQQQTFQLELRAKMTLDAMNDIARYLAAIPGRKNLIWLSGSFPLNVLPDTTGNVADPFMAMADWQDEFRDTVGLLARSQVAVYPIDARGLMTSPVFDASSSRNYTGARGAQRMSQDETKFSSDTINEHKTMADMALATGGQAFYNSNDITKAVANAIDEGSNFYTLTYAPTNPVHDGKLRKIKVDVARQGLTLAYRRGYYADDPSAATAIKPDSSRPVATDAAVTGAAGVSAKAAMRMAMTRGAPTPTEILMKVSVFPAGPVSETNEKPAQNNTLGPKAKGPFRTFNIGYAINPSDIRFLKFPDGKIHGDFDLIVFVYDPDGNVVNSMQGTIHIAASMEELQKAFASGIHYSLDVSTPVKGEYFFRVAVHDLNRDHYGVVEVASSSVKNLPPPTPAPAVK